MTARVSSVSPSRRARLLVVAGILAAHLAACAILSWRGELEPLEFFNLLLLAGNLVIGMILVRSERDLLLGAGVMLLVGAHGFLGHRLAPDALTSGALLLVNILVLYVGLKLYAALPKRYVGAFAAGYLLLFLLFIVGMENAEPLFLLFLLGLCACARSFRLSAFFWALTLSFTVGQPYAWQAALVSFFVLAALFGAEARLASRTALFFLAVGLLLVFLVLLPVILVLTGENLHSLGAVLAERSVRSALGTTFVTATVSTAFLVLWAVPLAYALSRLSFPGRAFLLSLIDIPIVIPQSAAGIALLVVFGRQQVIGEAIFRAFGLRCDGTILGICIAQVFVAMPFLVRTAVAAFDAVPERLEFAARTLGASSLGAFTRIALPLASRGILLGAVLAWARAAGEFGAVLFLAPTPETAPIAAWNRFNSLGVAEAGPLVALLLFFSLAIFFLLQLASRMLPAAGAPPASPLCPKEVAP